MEDLLVGIATHAESLAGGSASERYINLRRQLQNLSPLLGTLPKFLADAEDGWDFWNQMKRFDHYDERRSFIADEFTKYYADRLEQETKGITFEQALVRRDLLLDEELGHGGYGTVYKATHLTLEAPRAVKIFDPSFFSEEEDSSVRRFAWEAKLLERINHPNVVRLFDVGIAGDRPFIVTEFVDGLNLQSHLTAKGQVSEASARVVATQAASALQHVHSRSVFHRDIKPSNLMWDGQKLTILDFGAGVAVTTA